MNCGYLRNSDAGHHPGSANRARADSDLDAVGAGIDQGLRPGVGGHIAADDVDLGRSGVGLQPPHHLQHALGVAMRGIDYQQVDALLDERHCPLPGVTEVPNRCSDA